MTITQDQIQHIWEEDVRSDLFGSAPQSEHPVFLDVGGQPGSGKTRGAEHAAELMHPDDEFVHIDLDALREYHPGYDGLAGNPDPMAVVKQTNDFAWELTSRALDCARENGYSVLYEESFRDSARVLNRVQEFHDSGYETHVVALAVPPLVSWQGCVGRFCDDVVAGRPARWVEQDFHDQAFQGTAEVVAAAETHAGVDRVSVLNRMQEPVYDNEHDSQGMWRNPCQASEAVALQRGQASQSMVEEFWRKQELLDQHLGDSRFTHDDVRAAIGAVRRMGVDVFGAPNPRGGVTTTQPVSQSQPVRAPGSPTVSEDSVRLPGLARAIPPPPTPESLARVGNQPPVERPGRGGWQPSPGQIRPGQHKAR